MAHAVQLRITSDAHLRRAVATTLKLWFNQDVILEALCVVEDLFEQEGDLNYGVIAIVNNLANHFGWSKKMKHDARLQLYKNMLPDATLDPDPAKALAEFKKNRNVQKDTGKGRLNVKNIRSQAARNDDSRAQRPDVVVFCQLIFSIRKMVHSGYFAQYDIFKEVVREQVAELTISPHVIRWVDHLLTHTRTGPINVALTELQMSALVNIFYNAICEAVGPIDADKILTKVVTHTEKTPAAAQFSPKRFL